MNNSRDELRSRQKNSLASGAREGMYEIEKWIALGAGKRAVTR